MVEDLIKENKGSVIDVRTHAEFAGGHVAGSINIPLNEFPKRLDELKQMTSPLILCCASGVRSGRAESFLQNRGIDCFNGGSWMQVNYYQNQTV